MMGPPYCADGHRFTWRYPRGLPAYQVIVLERLQAAKIDETEDNVL